MISMLWAHLNHQCMYTVDLEVEEELAGEVLVVVTAVKVAQLEEERLVL